MQKGREALRPSWEPELVMSHPPRWSWLRAQEFRQPSRVRGLGTAFPFALSCPLCFSASPHLGPQCLFISPPYPALNSELGRPLKAGDTEGLSTRHPLGSSDVLSCGSPDARDQKSGWTNEVFLTCTGPLMASVNSCVIVQQPDITGVVLICP